MRIEQGVNIVECAYKSASKIKVGTIFLEEEPGYLDGVYAQYTVCKKMPNTKDMETYEKNKAYSIVAYCFTKEDAIKIASLLSEDLKRGDV